MRKTLFIIVLSILAVCGVRETGAPTATEILVEMEKARATAESMKSEIDKAKNAVPITQIYTRLIILINAQPGLNDTEKITDDDMKTSMVGTNKYTYGFDKLSEGDGSILKTACDNAKTGQVIRQEKIGKHFQRLLNSSSPQGIKIKEWIKDYISECKKGKERDFIQKDSLVRVLLYYIYTSEHAMPLINNDLYKVYRHDFYDASISGYLSNPTPKLSLQMVQAQNKILQLLNLESLRYSYKDCMSYCYECAYPADNHPNIDKMNDIVAQFKAKLALEQRTETEYQQTLKYIDNIYATVDSYKTNPQMENLATLVISAVAKTELTAKDFRDDPIIKAFLEHMAQKHSDLAESGNVLYAHMHPGYSAMHYAKSQLASFPAWCAAPSQAEHELSVGVASENVGTTGGGIPKSTTGRSGLPHGVEAVTGAIRTSTSRGGQEQPSRSSSSSSFNLSSSVSDKPSHTLSGLSSRSSGGIVLHAPIRTSSSSRGGREVVTRSSSVASSGGSGQFKKSLSGGSSLCAE